MAADGAGNGRRKGLRYWVGETLLTIAAVFGVLCVGLAIAAYVFGVSIVLFKTGSMSPDMPAGSMALVKKVPASELRLGDVVTVERPGQMPITHRVIDIMPAPELGDAGREIAMQGDANPAPDPLPYRVTEVKRVFFVNETLGKAVVVASNPWFLGGVSVIAGVLVMWAMWPRQEVGSDEAADEAAVGDPAAMGAPAAGDPAADHVA